MEAIRCLYEFTCTWYVNSSKKDGSHKVPVSDVHVNTGKLPS